MHRHPSHRRPLRLFTVLTAASALAATAVAGPTIDSTASGLGAVIVDVRDGGVIYQSGADRPQPPGAATQLMVLYLVAEAVDAGRLRLDELLSGPNGPRSVAEAVKALGGPDSGEAAASLARRLAGNEGRFTAEMTGRARALGMTRTRFSNVSGAAEDDQTTTAADMATLMWSLRRDFPQAGAWLGPDRRFSRMLRTASPPACLIPRIGHVRCAPGRDDPRGAVAVVMGDPRTLSDLVLLADAGRAVARRLFAGQGVVLAQTIAGDLPAADSGPGLVILVDRGSHETSL